MQKNIAAPQKEAALIIVDVQNDFLPGGSLAVPDGDTPRLKQSVRKATWPCRKQVYRHYHDDGTFDYDTLTLDTETVAGQPLLQQVMKSGKRLKSATSLKEIRQNVDKQIQQLPPALLSLDKTDNYFVKISKDLHQLTKNIRKS